VSSRARQEFIDIIRATEVIQQLLRDLEDDPLRILCSVCREHAETGQAVPDHHLDFYSYNSESALRALTAADLLRAREGSRYAVREYEPTEKGMALYHRLREEGACPP
jgi:hypothetical protein